jgi:FdhD protein
VNESIRTFPVQSSTGRGTDDAIAVEEPLEIRLTYGPVESRQRTVLAVTMRTPGHDSDLVYGHLAAERIIGHPSDLLECAADGKNEIRAVLHPAVAFDAGRNARSGYTTSSCGVCGKRSIDFLLQSIEPVPTAPAPADEHLIALPEHVREMQPLFARTGGIHAAAVMTPSGRIAVVREDVGRHNAADKVLGALFRNSAWPLAGQTLFVSGRASFELVQKAAVAGVSHLAAVGAPSSLAIELAKRVGLTLFGFVRDGRFNRYTTGTA